MKSLRPAFALSILALLILAISAPSLWAQVQPRLSPHSAHSTAGLHAKEAARY